MATIFMDNASIYGNRDTMLDGMYAEATGTGNLDMTTVGGLTAFHFPATPGIYRYFRYVLPSTVSTTLFCALRVRVEHLTAVDGRSPAVTFIIPGSLGNPTGYVTVWIDMNGRVVVNTDYTGTTTPGNTISGYTAELARSADPVISANTWHHMEIKVVAGGVGAGEVEIRLDDNDIPIISTGPIQTSTGTGFTGLYFGVQTNTSTSQDMEAWMTDIHVWDTTGTRNNDFLGDVSITTLWPNEDVETGWTPNYRHKLGLGVLKLVNDNAFSIGYTAADAAALELGSADYTLETFIRFSSLPTTNERRSIIAKWREDNNTRSFQLSKCGPTLNSGNVEFRISTDGSAVTTIHSYPWEPETDRWYHIAVVRDSGSNLLFIDGVQQGVPVADANTYYNGTAVLIVGARTGAGSGGVSPVALSGIQGWLDETRITTLVARYTANFIPTTVPFGRNSTDDPNFADVVLLAGYDTGIVDESSYVRTLTPRNQDATSGSIIPVINTPDDGNFQYETINQEDSPTGVPRDDTNISASLYAAAAILTLSDNPADTETVTIEGVVYTFKTVLASAFDVLIGADEEESLANLMAAINEDAGAGTLYGTGTTAHPDVYSTGLPSPQVKVIARTAGTAGNALTVSETLDGSWDNATLTGGADIPGPSSFRFTRLPPGVTTIRSVMAVTRAYKTEAGPAKMITSFVGPAGAADDGSERSLTVEPTYRIEVFEEDPDTSGPITPSTLLTGRVRFDRTE